jgi:nucleoid DNA-binding protein
MAELVPDLIAIRFVEMSGQGQVAGTTQGILLPFRADRPIFVSEAQVDVVLEPSLVRPVVLVRIECLHDVLFASLTVLGCRRQVIQVDEKVLRPVLPVLLWHRPVRVPVDPVADVLGKPFVEFVEVLWHDEPIVPDVVPVCNRERIGLPVFTRKIGRINSLIFDCGGIALHGDTSFRKDLNCMRASLRGRDELVARVQQALAVPTKKEAEHIVDAVIGSLEITLLNNLETNGFTLKLGSFGKFSVHHKPGILRRIPFTGETILTKDKRKVRFVSLGRLRQCGRVIDKH